MNAWSLARRGLLAAVGWWWRQAQPSTGADLRGTGVARPEHETGRPPTPGERWLPSAPVTGPWADVDPHAAGRWPRRPSLLALAGWGALVWLRVRRDLRAGVANGSTHARRAAAHLDQNPGVGPAGRVR